MELKSKITVIIGSGARIFIRTLYDKYGGIHTKPYCEREVAEVECPEFDDLIKREVAVLQSYAEKMKLRLNEPILSLDPHIDKPLINVLRILKQAFCASKRGPINLFIEDGDAGLNALQTFLVGHVITRMVKVTNLNVVVNVNNIDFLRGITSDDTTIYVVVRGDDEMKLVEYDRRDIIPPFFEAAALAVYREHPEE